MNKNIGRAIRFDDYVVYDCPRCGDTTLTFDKDSFIFQETASSQQNSKNSINSDPDDIKYKFTGWLKCNNNLCNEAVSCLGDAFINSDIEEKNGKLQLICHRYYRPIIFSPSLKYIHLPSQCSNEVSSSLEEAFQLTLLSPNAAANKIRIAIEYLLSNIHATEGKKLHSRIEAAYKDKKISTNLRDLLLAIKWLGNDGSHANITLSTDDILFAYSMIEKAFEEIYPIDDPFQKNVQEILKNKGVKK